MWAAAAAAKATAVAFPVKLGCGVGGLKAKDGDETGGACAFNGADDIVVNVVTLATLLPTLCGCGFT